MSTKGRSSTAERRERDAADRVPRVAKAEVLSVPSEDEVLLRRVSVSPDEILRAEVAVVGYEPEPGDRVLVTEAADGFYVLAVLGAARRRQRERPEPPIRTISATQRVIINAPDVELRATRIGLVATKTNVRADHVETNATTIAERTKFVDRIAEESQTNVGRSRTVVASDYEIVAGRTSIASEGDTIIDGERVLLG